MLSPFRRLLAHDRLWQLSPFCSVLAHPFAGFSHDRLSQFSSFCSLLAHGRFWQLSLFAAFSHMIALAALAFSQSSRTRRLLAASAPPRPATPQSSCTQSLLAALALRSFPTQSHFSSTRSSPPSHTQSPSHPHLRQPLALRGSAKTRAGSNHGEPTPLTLASRCGSVGPLLRPRECTTTSDPQGEHDEARGSRPQDVGVSSLRPHSQRPTEGARRRRTASRLSTSPPKLTKQLRRADKA